MNTNPSRRTLELLQHVWPSPCDVEPGSTASTSPNTKTISLVALPFRKEPTLFVPHGPARVVAGAVHGYKSPSDRRARTRASAVAAVARCGAARGMPTSVTVHIPTQAPNVVNSCAEALGTRVLASIYIGTPRANQKPVLQLLDRSGQARGFAKVAVSPFTERRLLAEASAIQLLSSKTWTTLRVPRVVSVESVGDHRYMLLSPLDTWSAEGIRSQTRESALRELVGGFPQTTGPVVESRWWKRLAGKVDGQESSDSQALLSGMSSVAAALGNRETQFGAMHGDWSPWNMMTEGPRATVWDWERFSLESPLGLDALNFSFRSLLRSPRHGAASALDLTISDSARLVQSNGASGNNAATVTALFLLELGERYLRYSPLGGTPHGPLSAWLLPSLSRAISGIG